MEFEGGEGVEGFGDFGVVGELEGNFEETGEEEIEGFVGGEEVVGRLVDVGVPMVIGEGLIDGLGDT